MSAMTEELRRFGNGLSVIAPRTGAALNGLARLVESDPQIASLLTDVADESAVKLPGLRVLAGLHELVLTGRAPNLKSVMYDGTGDVVAAVRTTMLEHPDKIRAALRIPVQQHTPHRTLPLIRGLAMLGVRNVRLLEIGACAGLTLQPDRYHVSGQGWTWGDPRSPVHFTADGPAPAAVIVSRRGCDLDPSSPSDSTRAIRMHSYLPPEFTALHRLLDSGLAIAAEHPLPIDAASAGDWLMARLDEPVESGVHTVVWHSLVWHLLPPAEQQVVASAIDEAAERMPISRIAFEPVTRSGDRPVLQVFMPYSPDLGRSDRRGNGAVSP
jgi:hypothetical protein